MSVRQGLVPWLRPGLGIKRWLGVALLGVAGTSAGAGSLLWNLVPRAGETIGGAWDVITLQFIPTPWHQLVYVALGLALLGVACRRVALALLSPFAWMPGSGHLAEAIGRERSAQAGPRVCVLGGGNLCRLLIRGLKAHASDLTVIVPLPEGASVKDIASGLAALARSRPAAERLFLHELPGQTLGELLVQALIEEHGSTAAGLEAAAGILDLQGRVLSVCSEAGRWPTEAVERLLDADLIVLNGEFDMRELLSIPGFASSLQLASGVKVIAGTQADLARTIGLFNAPSLAGSFYHAEVHRRTSRDAPAAAACLPSAEPRRRPGSNGNGHNVDSALALLDPLPRLATTEAEPAGETDADRIARAVLDVYARASAHPRRRSWL